MNTLFDKIWDVHVVQKVEDGPTQLYIDRLYCHEVTSPQAFAGLRARGIKCFRPEKIFCMPDHNTPTHDQDKPIEDPVSKAQVDTLAKNAEDFGLEHFGMMDKKNGIIHVVGPERGLTLPGMTIVCGDSHTSTHGAMGAVAFGIGTSEVEMVMASQCILQTRPKTMRITVDGKLGKGVTAKDVALYMMSKMTTSGATGYFVEYAGEAVRSLSMEGRLTLCNLSIEMGARGGMVAPDETTFEYIKGREYAPKGEAWDKALAYWKTLKSAEDAVFDKEVRFDAADIEPMITYGTNPGMGMGITQHIPAIEGMGEAAKASFMKSMEYMGFRPGEPLLGKKIDYVFLGACTNGRIEDFRAFASIVKGRKKAADVVAWLVPGSWMVDAQIREEGLDKVLEEAGFAIRQPGCSACLAMNDDKVPAGKYAVSTSNRNFEGRQGPGARTLLASPLVAAAAAVTGPMVKFIQSDLFENVTGSYDLIISNPPYITTEECGKLMPEVKEHEPMLALDGKEDGLYFYKKIIKEAKNYLNPDGMLAFEIGYDQGEAVKNLMEAQDFDCVEIKKDLAGLDRLVFGFAREGE